MNITKFQDDDGSSKNDKNISTFVPAFEVILIDLNAFHGQLQIALEEGVRLGMDYFKSNKLSIDVFLLSQLIRYHTKLVMKQKASVNLYEMNDLANNGLAGIQNGYHIRIFKGYHGNIPVPNSDTKVAFYCQQLEFNMELAPLVITKPNVFFLWELSKDYALMPLRLVCPQYAEKGHDVTTTYYNEILANPAIKNPDNQVEGISNNDNLDIKLKDNDLTQNEKKDDDNKTS